MFTSPHHHLEDTGKVTVAMLLAGLAVFVLTVFFDIENGGHVASVQATSTATTSVTVLNTPPAWTLTAREQYASATTTPSNSGTTTSWVAIGTDSNGENYYLLICKSSSTPVGVNGTAPRCNGGVDSDQWGVSASTVSGAQATVSTTTTEAMAEKNDWYGYICDGNAGNARCSASQYNGLHEGAASATSSPFVVNHRPTFTVFADDTGKKPGELVTWTTTATDTDQIRGGDQIKINICKAQDFSTSTSFCGGGGFWASTTFSLLNNPTATATVPIPTQDHLYASYGYVIDQFYHEAVYGGASVQGNDSGFLVQNAAPTVSSSSIQVYDRFGTTTADQAMALVTEEGVTNNFVVQFYVDDDNSCQQWGGGNEISDVDINVFRSAIGGANGLGCDAIDEFNANNCYTHTATSTWWAPTCYQVPSTCAGAGDSTATWECTFHMWYVADPTDAGSQYSGEDWRASARASDEALLGSYSTYNGAVDIAGSANMTQFLSFRATGSPIAYGSWEPGQGPSNHPATTTVYATGNTGLDQYLSGDAMCVTYPSCYIAGSTGTSTIFVPYQHYSLTNSTLYAAGTVLSTSTTPTFLNSVIIKTQATSTPANDDTYWSILVPGTITFAGDYIGRNYIDGVVAPSGEW